MHCNQAGIALIKRFEGLMLTAYQDQAGIWTIGWGHTDPRLKAGMTITEEKAEELFKADLAAAESCVNQAISVPLTDNQFSALCSFVFNIGCAKFKDPSKCSVVTKLHMGRPSQALKAWGDWHKVTINGKKVPSAGLAARRREEIALFLKPPDIEDPDPLC